MFDNFLSKIKQIFSSRLLPITIAYGIFVVILVIRLFQIQIVEKDIILEEGNYQNEKTREIATTRGNIYDRNGVLLAYNTLTYSVVLEDNTSNLTGAKRNAMLHDLIVLLEKYGNELENDFPISINENGEFIFTKEGNSLLRFKADLYGHGSINSLTKEEKESSAQTDFEKFRYGFNRNNLKYNISDEYTVEEALKIMTLRYTIETNFPKYSQILITSNVDEKTVAAVLENSYRLPGVLIKQQASRKYNESYYASHILGYTGLINAEELETYNAEEDIYTQSDRVGKTGIEKEYESYLAGEKGSELILVNASNKYVKTLERSEPVPGQDLYLTIDIELTKKYYEIVEKNLADILLAKIVNSSDAGTRGRSSSDIKIPIYDVYYALINNNVINVKNFSNEDASAREKATYEKYLEREAKVIGQLNHYLDINNKQTVTELEESLQDYASSIYRLLRENSILLTKQIDTTDQTYLKYQNNEIGLNEFLQYAISKNWVDLTKLNVGSEYYSTEELYLRLVDIIIEKIKTDSNFYKRVYKDLVYSYKLSGSEICLLLFEQGVLEYNEDEITRLENRSISAYTFITNKIEDLAITPAQLALEPSSASVVVTDVNKGDVLAMITYPSYDNNMFANRIDSTYYAQLNSDLTGPMYHRATKESIAPGSTFKMITSIAGLEEGIITPSKRITDLVQFTRISPSPKCWADHSHGTIDVTEALEVSCNYFFYELSYNLGLKYGGSSNRDEMGIKELNKYATLLGLAKKSGIEIEEAEPSFSTKDAVRSSIGQGSSQFTPIQLSRYVTTLASSGKVFDLTLIEKIQDKSGTIILQEDASYEQIEDISPSTWELVQEGMYKVAHGSESSSSRLLRDFPYAIAGKTGTAQITVNHANHALFVSYAPYEAPEISMTVVVPNGYSSSSAVKLSYDLYSAYYNTKSIDEILNQEEGIEVHAGPAIGD